MWDLEEKSRARVKRESIPVDDSAREGGGQSTIPSRWGDLTTAPLRPVDLLRLQRQAGNQATVGLLSQVQGGRSVQRMDEGSSPRFPASITTIPGKGTVTVKNEGSRLEGEVIEIFVKKQISRFEEARLVDPHLKHWWFLFKVKQGERAVWMQVDLTVSSGYRIIWDAAKVEDEGIGYEEKKVPSGLTSTMIEDATQELARTHLTYYNPKIPDDKYPRYSCQDFVEKLAGRLGITL